MMITIVTSFVGYSSILREVKTFFSTRSDSYRGKQVIKRWHLPASESLIYCLLNGEDGITTKDLSKEGCLSDLKM